MAVAIIDALRLLCCTIIVAYGDLLTWHIKTDAIVENASVGTFVPVFGRLPGARRTVTRAAHSLPATFAASARASRRIFAAMRRRRGGAALFVRWEIHINRRLSRVAKVCLGRAAFEASPTGNEEVENVETRVLDGLAHRCLAKVGGGAVGGPCAWCFSPAPHHHSM